jgi:protein phosphatase
VIEGLYDANLLELLRAPGTSDTGSTPAQRIVQAAVANSGRDNTTAVVVEII